MVALISTWKGDSPSTEPKWPLVTRLLGLPQQLFLRLSGRANTELSALA